jgi:hypothetical protein
MKKNQINTISSRYGDSRHITNQGGGCYTVEGLAHYTRQSTDESGNITMLDFDGGPCLFVGGKFNYDPSNSNAVIESIILDNCVPVQKKYNSTVDGEEKTATMYNVKISVTVG